MDWARHERDWPQAEHSRFITQHPHKWHVQQYGKGPLLLLIHGAGGATQSWRHLGPLLAQSYTIVALDLPGQGFSRLGARRRCGLDGMSEDLLSLINAQGWAPAALIGHSAGGAIALRLAEMLPAAPPVIGINAALGNFKGLAGVVFPLMAKALAAMPLVADLFTASSRRPKSVQRLIDGTGSKLSQPDMEFYRRLVSDRDHVDATLEMMAQWSLDPLLARLPEHPSNCLLITGDGDLAVPPSVSAQIAQKMPQCQHISLPGLGHLAHEEDAETVAKIIQNFLRTQALT